MAADACKTLYVTWRVRALVGLAWRMSCRCLTLYLGFGTGGDAMSWRFALYNVVMEAMRWK